MPIALDTTYLDSLDIRPTAATIDRVTMNFETPHTATRRRHRPSDYVAELLSELQSRFETEAMEDQELRDCLGDASEAADLIFSFFPKPSPWAKVVGPVYTTRQLEKFLDCSRQAIRDRAKRGTLLALTTSDGHIVYPAFQFDGPQVIQGLSSVLQAIGDSVDAWTLASWLQADQSQLGANVVDYLSRHGDDPVVVQLATSAAEHWSR
jgi:hypothetical protein